VQLSKGVVNESVGEEVFYGVVADDQAFVGVNTIHAAKFADDDVPEFALFGQGFADRYFDQFIGDTGHTHNRERFDIKGDEDKKFSSLHY